MARRRSRKLENNLLAWVVLLILWAISSCFGAIRGGSQSSLSYNSYSAITSTRPAMYQVAALTITARHENLLAQSTPTPESGGKAADNNVLATVRAEATPTTLPTVVVIPTETPTPNARAVVLADVLNVRAGPSTNESVIGQVSLNQCLEVVLVGGGWYKLALADGQEGWASGAFLDVAPVCLGGSVVVARGGTASPTENLAENPTAVVAVATPRAQTAQNANLRAGPGTDYGVVGGVSAGEALEVVARTADGSWLKLGNGAWIAAFLVDNGPFVRVTNDIPPLPPTATPRPIPTAAPAAPVAPAFVNPGPGIAYRVGAICWDGWLSGATGRGACSHHGGVRCWRMSDGGCR